MTLNDVTLVCVSSINHIDSINSLLKCKEVIKFCEIKFISDVKPRNFDNRIEFIKIEQLKTKNDYSKFILYELYKHINTLHCLIVQHDGYITHPEMWNDIFLNYDYIGAPWPIKKCYVNQFGEQCRVGNGGFSLRSRRLLEMPSKLKIDFDIGEYKNEDLNFCVFNKHLYESNGIKIANIDVAKYFSHELYTPEIENIIPFGIHGKPIQPST